jgi:H+/gluconate symporter-like permease
MCAVLPVILMLLGTVVDLTVGPLPVKEDMLREGYVTIASYYRALLSAGGSEGILLSIGTAGLTFIKFLSDANIALFSAVLFSLFFLGVKRGAKMDDLMKSAGHSIGAVSMIILIIGAGGAFSQVLKDGNVTDYISSIATGIRMNPLLMAFSVAAIIRLAIGSATVSTLTTAPLMLPIAQQTGTSPELMVLATGAGSVMWSHFNDTGFWMFKEYFNLSIKQTFLSWTVMECIIGIAGIVTVLIMNMFM